jgi:hypothetical protein
MTDKLTQDVARALYGLRTAFAKHNIPCPDVLEYSDPQKAYQAIAPLRVSLSYNATQWVMTPDAKPWAEMSLEGFTVRFEPRKIERPGTGGELDNGIDGRIFYDD